MPEIAAVILAGGLSSRMGGGDKALALIDGRPILAWIIKRLQPQASVIALNANGEAKRFADCGLPVISDSRADFAGPLAGVEAALIWAASLGYKQVLTVAADAPFLPSDLAVRLIDASPGKIAVAQSFGRLHPTFSLWPVTVAEALTAYLDRGERRMKTFIEQHPHAAVDFPATQLPGGEIDAFFNINTPDDLAKARRLVKTSGA